MIADEPISPVNLCCEYLYNPLGIDETNPRLSWQLMSNIRGEKQSADRILVASTQDLLSSDKGDLWAGVRISNIFARIIYC